MEKLFFFNAGRKIVLIKVSISHSLQDAKETVNLRLFNFLQNALEENCETLAENHFFSQSLLFHRHI